MLALCAGLLRCDLAPPSASSPPRLVATSVDPDARGYAEHGLRAPIWLWFDRPLWPRSVNRGTVTLQSGELSLTPRLRYDPVQRAVRVELDPADVRTDLEYLLVLRGGISSWDGATASALATMRVRFTDRPAAAQRTVSLRRDVAPALAAACGAASCHGGAQPVMGLDLSSAEALLRTTVGRPSREWRASSVGGEFYWGGLALIEPGAPGESFLVYKLIGDGPMRGARMPRGAAPLDPALVQQVSDWIAAGASDDR